MKPIRLPSLWDKPGRHRVKPKTGKHKVGGQHRPKQPDQYRPKTSGKPAGQHRRAEKVVEPWTEDGYRGRHRHGAPVPSSTKVSRPRTTKGPYGVRATAADDRRGARHGFYR